MQPFFDVVISDISEFLLGGDEVFEGSIECTLRFKQCEGLFRHGVVVTVPDGAARLTDIVRFSHQ